MIDIEQKIAAILELDKQFRVVRAAALLDEMLKAIMPTDRSCTTLSSRVKRNVHLFSKGKVAQIYWALSVRNRIAHGTEVEPNTDSASKVLLDAAKTVWRKAQEAPAQNLETWTASSNLTDEWVIADKPAVAERAEPVSHELPPLDSAEVGSELLARNESHSALREVDSAAIESSAPIPPQYDSRGYAVRLTVDDRTFVRHYFSDVVLSYRDFRGACEKAHLAQLAEMEIQLSWEVTGIYSLIKSRHVSYIGGHRTTNTKQRLPPGDSIFALERLKVRISIFPMAQSSKE